MNTLTIFDMGFFEPSVMGGHGGNEGRPPPHYNFVVIFPMIMKLRLGIKPDVLYTMVTKNLWHHYYYVTMTSWPVF